MKLKKNKKNKELGMDDEACIKLVQVASIQGSKNQLLLIDMVDRLNREGINVRLMICGGIRDQDYYLKVQQRIELLKDKDSCLLLGCRNDITEIINDADIFISPSKYEGLPISVIEALCTGIKIILSPIQEHIDAFQKCPYVFFFRVF